ncbi:MAG: methylated-DNA--[protein]-cysteine S-methyltransferase [Burkholderiaceae bacterium]
MSRSTPANTRELINTVLSDQPVVTKTISSPLGVIILAAQGSVLLGVWFEGQRHFAGIEEAWVNQPDHPVLRMSEDQLKDYFAGRLAQFDLPLAPRGTVFQRRVWQALLTIPIAKLTSYGEVARQLGAGRGVRAVAAAIGRNPISLIIPCHRVVAANGSLTGYAGGLDRKEQLLSLEERFHASA